MRSKFVCILVALFFSLVYANGQDHLYGFFNADTIKVGEPVTYTLVYKHAPEVEVLFPDEKTNFFPFQITGKEFFPTITSDNISTDSAIYHLQTFEIDSILKLALPVFIISSGDSIRKTSAPDSVNVRLFITDIQKSSIRGNNTFLTIETRFNYPYFIAVSLISIVAGVIFYLVLGKSIVRRYRLFVIRSAHQNFLKAFEKLEKDYKSEQNLSSVEKALHLWKNYLTKLENKPISTYTSTEIINLYQQEELLKGLQNIDRAIYGGRIDNELERTLTVLKKFSNKRFLTVKNEISNGA
ncbi:MAG: hypothetical protein ACK40G_17905 [Cytophagaceae bacterium]